MDDSWELCGVERSASLDENIDENIVSDLAEDVLVELGLDSAVIEVSPAEGEGGGWRLDLMGGTAKEVRIDLPGRFTEAEIKEHIRDVLQKIKQDNSGGQRWPRS